MDQWGTLLGVLVGAVASYAVTALTERARWRRAQAERWQEKKFDVYARYSNALKEQIGITQRIGAALGYAHVVDPLEPAEGLPLLAEAEARRAEAQAREAEAEAQRTEADGAARLKKGGQTRGG